MKSLLIVSDPMSSGVSVQLNVINFFRSKLGNKFNVFVYWNGISADKEALRRKTDLDLLHSVSGVNISKLLPRKFKSNEALLWIFSWFTESILGVISRDVSRVVKDNEIDLVVNVSSTIPCKSDICVIQGIPFFETLRNIGRTNYIARLLIITMGLPIFFFERKLLRRFKTNSKEIVANSRYIKEYYEKLGLQIKGTLHTIKDFSEFKATGNDAPKDYVLSYMGKETEVDTLLEIAKRGVKIVAFGSKIPPGISLDYLKSHIVFEGHVDEERLINMYSNALFTAFPFTEEPFGYIPLESSLCGTPVLTYGKQGPLETVIDSKNGWLVSNREDFISKAVGLWKEKYTGIDGDTCISTAKSIIDSFSHEFDALVLELTEMKKNSPLI